jgi:transcriptional regulator with XRE-family HTH domain
VNTNELELLVEGRAAAESGRGARLREAARLSQSDLARIVGTTPATISRWEAGLRKPRGSLAVAYAQALRKVAQVIASHG